MNKILGLLFGIKDVKFRADDDFTDRLSRRYTTGLFTMFALIVTTGTYVGERIACWCPAQFTDTHKAYASQFCWVQSTYYIPLEDALPDDNSPRQMINYYQWVPLILLLQALLTYFPSVVWRMMCRRSGLSISAIVDSAIAGQRTTYVDIREKTVRYAVHQIDRYLMTRATGRGACTRWKVKAAKYCCLFYGQLYGNFLVVSYMFIKLLYIVNAVGQLYMLDLFLGANYHFYGIQVMQRFFRGDDWLVSERFPRVTMCEFRVRHMNQLHKYVVQCILPINLFNEKIFIFVWFWLCILCILSSASFLSWLWRCCFWQGQVRWVKSHIKPFSDVKCHRDIFRRFTQDYLRRDGLFILRILSNNVGNISASEVLCGLWDNFGPERRYAAEIASGRMDADTLDARGGRNRSVPTNKIELPLQRLHRVDSV